VRHPQQQEEEGYLYDDQAAPPRLPSSARRYTSSQAVAPATPTTVVRLTRHTVPPRASYTTSTMPSPTSAVSADTTASGVRRAATSNTTAKALHRRPAPRFHWLVYLGGATCLLAAAWLGLLFLANWWHVKQEDLTYGRPRTSQTDAVVGHHDSVQSPSHFTVINLHRQIIVVEFPGGDASHAKVYLGPLLVGDGQELMPVTLQFKDVNHDGKPDMLLCIGDQRIAFLNDTGAFRPQKPGEQVQV
jgi:hypothetical protein